MKQIIKELQIIWNKIELYIKNNKGLIVAVGTLIISIGTLYLSKKHVIV